MDNKQIAVLTINFNTEKLIDRFIDSLSKQTYKNWFLLIANNSDSDILLKEIKEKYSKLDISILNINKNIGYSKANNFSYKYLEKNLKLNEDDLVLFSNEDIIIEDPDFFKKTIDFFNKYKCNFLGPRIINKDGSMMLPHKNETGFLKCLFHFGNNGIPDKIFNINIYYKKNTNPKEVFLVNGACFFVRYADFIKTGMFDENTFIYYAEELLFRKAKKVELKTLYVPELYVNHEHSGAVKKNYNPIFKKRFVYDAEIYFLKEVLKTNKFLMSLFRFERKIEFLFLSMFRKLIMN